jgi:ribosomal-protein-alanine N-acetyltransferase
MAMSLDAAFTKFPILSTTRLSLREIRETDAKELFKIKSNRELTQGYGGMTHSSIEHTLRWITQIQEGYKNREGLFWCITLNHQDDAIGSCMFWHFDESFKCEELGYELNPDFCQIGLVILQYGFG